MNIIQSHVSKRNVKRIMVVIRLLEMTKTSISVCCCYTEVKIQK